VRNIAEYAVADTSFNIRDLMASVLQTTIDIYGSAQMPLPAKQFWTMGQPAQDCEQVTVSFVQAYLGTPGDEASTPQRCSTTRTAVLAVSIARCIPIGVNGKPVSAEKMMEFSEFQAIDAWLLIDNLQQYNTWGDLSQGPGVIATVDVPEPQGGMQAVNLTLTIAIP